VKYRPIYINISKFRQTLNFFVNLCLISNISLGSPLETWASPGRNYHPSNPKQRQISAWGPQTVGDALCTIREFSTGAANCNYVVKIVSLVRGEVIGGSPDTLT
jgi:hypothetical protein